MKILIVEDERILAETIKTLLIKEGYTCDCVYDGESGASFAEAGVYDLIILDVMLPLLDGVAVARRLRENHCSTPILMLTAKSALSDRINGLRAGADYYLTKPFDSNELLACIQALLRRQGSYLQVLHVGNTTLDLESNILKTEKEEIQLSGKEFDIMHRLMGAPNRNHAKELLLEQVWGFDSNATENHVEVYIGFLRKKLQNIASNVRIVTVRKLGYHLEVDFGDTKTP